MLIHRGTLVACLVALAVALFAGPAQGTTQPAIAPDPAWIELQPVRGDAGTAAVADDVRFLLVDDQVNLLGAKPVWHRRLVERVISERALADAARLSIDFQPLYQRVEIHAVELLRDGGRIDRRQRADIQVLRRESDMESGILDGRLTVQVTVPDVRVGDRIDYRFSVTGANPIFGSEYHDTYAAGYGIALAERRVLFLHRPDVTLRHRVDGPGYSVAQGGGEGYRSLEFRASDLPRIVEDDDTPQWHDGFGRLRVSTLEDWPAVAAWAKPLYPARLMDRALAAELVAKLQLDAADPVGSMERAIAFVQGEVRYTAIDMGSHSHAPSPPETTLERRFGDCKDKSSLLVSLLAEAGIEAEPVLVNTHARSAVARRLPIPLAFDHFVLRARTDAGDVWIDATRSRERAPLHAREPLPFRYGLPVHAGGGLVEIPAPKPALPDVEVTQRIRLHASGGEARALFGVVTDYRRGEAEDRRVQYEDSARGDIGERYLSYMRSFYDGIAAAGRPDAAEPPAPGVMRTVEGYRLDWNLQRDGQAFGIVLFQLGDWLPTLAQGTRTAPRLLAGPQYATHTIRVDYPRGWSITPGEDRVENPWFTFERRVDVEGDDLVVSGSWRRHADDVPAADYARFRTDMERARDLLAYQVDLDATPAVFSARAADWAWPAAATVALAALLGLAWRRRRRDRLSGMLFAPRPTMAALLQRPRAWWPALALMALTAVLGAAPDFVDESLGGNLVLAIVSLVSSLAWFPLYTLLLMGCLRMLSVRAGYGNLLLAAAWACVPYLLFLLLAGMALGGRIEVFADGHEMQPSDLPGVLLAVLLVLTGLCWSLVTSVNAGAVAASTGRAKMFGAFALSFLFLVGLALVVGLVAAVVYFSRGGVL
ncbi:DUF3857 domain-containing protein [Luteimonas changyuni]|uniref:DUF3857 domain-containing protein n=1 Tax=Luteimonas sp. MJ145 TaxID=3129234 RepID=UPI0031BB5010